MYENQIDSNTVNDDSVIYNKEWNTSREAPEGIDNPTYMFPTFDN